MVLSATAAAFLYEIFTDDSARNLDFLMHHAIGVAFYYNYINGCAFVVANEATGQFFLFSCFSYILTLNDRETLKSATDKKRNRRMHEWSRIRATVQSAS